MVSPGVPLPDRVGVVSLVVLSPRVPLSLVGSSLAAGATGPAVSTTTVTSSGLVVVLPAGSVALTLRALLPCGSAVVGVMDHLPDASTTAVPMTAPVASLMAMTSPGVPAPLRVGVLSLVVLSPRVPVSLLGSSTAVSAPVPVVAGAVVSMVMGSVAGALVLPAGSVAVTARLFRPSGSAVVGVMAHLPAASTTAVPSTVPSGALRVMVSPGVPVPSMVGVLSLVTLSPRVPLSLAGARLATGAAGARVSMTSGSVAAGLVLPAGSVAVTAKAMGPSGRAVVGVAAQLPSGCTVVVAITLPCGSLRVMVSPGVPVPVPVMVGVLSLVMPSPRVPLSLGSDSAAAGVAGPAVSTAMLSTSGALAVVLPAGSVAVMTSGLLPVGSGVVGVMAQVPLASTVAVPIRLPAASLMATVSPGVPVPLMVGVVSLVMPSPSLPLSLVGSSTAVSAPAPVVAGAVVSMMTGSGAGALVLPAGSVAVTVRALGPSGSGVVGVMAQVPSAATTAVPMTLPCGSLRVMVSPAVPCPLSVGVVSLVVLSSSTPVSLLGSSRPVGAAGAVVSIVTGTGVGALVLPAGSVAVTARLFKPSGKALVGVADHVPSG